MHRTVSENKLPLIYCDYGISNTFSTRMCHLLNKCKHLFCFFFSLSLSLFVNIELITSIERIREPLMQAIFLLRLFYDRMIRFVSSSVKTVAGNKTQPMPGLLFASCIYQINILQKWKEKKNRGQTLNFAWNVTCVIGTYYIPFFSGGLQARHIVCFKPI